MSPRVAKMNGRDRHGPAMRMSKPIQIQTLASLLAPVFLLLAGCSSAPTTTEPPTLSPTRAREVIGQLLPPGIGDRSGWAADLYAAFGAIHLPTTVENFCAAIAITEQETGFKVDPPVPGLSAIAWREIESRAAGVGLPRAAVRTALKLPSPDGRSYAERIDAARTERELSEIFEDLIARVPLGVSFLSGRNPVRTGGPMQVSIAFAEQYAQDHLYPYPVESSLRREVFTRRGGLFFGVAHLLDYPAAYEAPVYRFADFNAGQYASRNAGFQRALSLASGIPLALDGDLLRSGSTPRDPPGSTELAARVLAERLGVRESAIRRDLELGRADAFSESTLYRRVFALADELEGKPIPRAHVPEIRLKSPKITRRLTTEWFARRVDERYQRCLARRPATVPSPG